MSLPASAAPIAVKSATGVITATGVWGMLITLASILIVAVVAYIKVMPRLKELENTNNAGLRKEFIDEMAALRGEVRSSREESEGLREEVRTLRQEVRRRDDKIDQLRSEIRELHGVIDGMRRENMAAQIHGQRAVVEAMPDDLVPPATRAALKRIQGAAE